MGGRRPAGGGGVMNDRQSSSSRGTRCERILRARCAGAVARFSSKMAEFLIKTEYALPGHCCYYIYPYALTYATGTRFDLSDISSNSKTTTNREQ